jgi:hypothetical protein
MKTPFALNPCVPAAEGKGGLMDGPADILHLQCGTRGAAPGFASLNLGGSGPEVPS